MFSMAFFIGALLQKFRTFNIPLIIFNRQQKLPQTILQSATNHPQIRQKPPLTPRTILFSAEIQAFAKIRYKVEYKRAVFALQIGFKNHRQGVSLQYNGAYAQP